MAFSLPKLFTIQGNDIGLARDELALIPEFRLLLVRDKGSKGDNDGRKKYQASRELAYVYFMADFKSPFIYKGDKERDKDTRLEVMMPENWQPDNHVKAAIKRYNELQETSAIRTYKNVLKGLRLSELASETLLKQLEIIVERNTKKIEAANDATKVIELIEGNEAMISLINKLIGLTSTVNEAVENLEKVEERIMSQGENNKKIVGGGTIFSRENPE